MKKLFSQSKRNLGAMPGAVIHIGESRTEKISIELIDYSESDVEDRIVDNLVDLDRFKKTPSDSWININGIHDTGVVSKIGELFLIHPLVQEDIVNTTQRPKLEDYDNYLFIVLKMLTFNEKLDEIESEQVSVILGEKYLITFQEKEGDVFDFVRDRIKNNKGRIRRMGMDFLAYSLIDAIVDHYFAILERIGDKIDILDDTLIEDSEQINVHEIHKLKKNILMLRKAIWPLRELLNNFQKVESKLISDKLDLFLRDVYDHTIQIMDTVDTYRDLLSGMLDMYLSNISNRMNSVMKVLTIIATIFIPLTFIVGVYGMNFKFMPELGWKYGYLSIWIVMILVFASMLAFFRKKKWL